ncbi:tyrosine-type recombinase/integrase [Pectobacterium versatile]|uniref:tyrosine-type recombinase/integrase n=1 Tax=Pectobacterium TaxID=122277 RepID=UPI000B7BD62F|nr:MULTISPECIES: tyrosine-type recombinase/integrase [Pectobacterium]ASN87069.1 Integrase [Pectobacterium versatile]MBQ4790302.1 tyrosine-type recombinase/integrase [Pectobacterium versatile]MCH5048849.1 tyrosine-type recombinase/integrase [Pectobacterium aquaticum]MCL6366767.1 integrase [Pectobacterium carotovorum subsp. carotovorum]MCL6400119.1 integrase [Pectobacterium carotovorum subsp. carotovorum]
MGSKTKNQYLYKHESGIWMFQISVPRHMRHLISGRKLFRKSTGQRDVLKARVVRDRLVVEWNHVKEKHAIDTGVIALNRAINAVQQFGATSQTLSGRGVMLQATANEYLSEYMHSRSPSTLSKHTFATRLFLKYLNVADTALTGVSRTEVTGFIRSLKPTKSAQTIQNYLSCLNTVYEYARRCYDNIPAASPFIGHRLEAKRTIKSYEPFTQDEIKTLLINTSEDLRDVILIGLYSGMRLDEIASLKVSDVSLIEGVMCFSVSTAKTKAGVRVVPVHPALLEIVHKYKQMNQQEKRGEYLLPRSNLIKRLDGKRGPWYSQQFTRLRDKVLPSATDRQCFHSLRGMFITILDRAGVQEDRIAQIVGHERGKTESLKTYSSGAELAELAGYVALVAEIRAEN